MKKISEILGVVNESSIRTLSKVKSSAFEDAIIKSLGGEILQIRKVKSISRSKRAVGYNEYIMNAIAELKGATEFMPVEILIELEADIDLRGNPRLSLRAKMKKIDEILDDQLNEARPEIRKKSVIKWLMDVKKRGEKLFDDLSDDDLIDDRIPFEWNKDIDFIISKLK